MNLIKSQELSTSLRTELKPVYLRKEECKSFSRLEIALLSVLTDPVILLTLGMAIATMTTLGINQKVVMAQTPSTSKSTSAGVRSISQVRVLFVNPNMGDDKTGNGQQQSPLRTITQAIQVAQPNTTIILTKGIYSKETGEQFPLLLKPGISIEGDPRSQGQGITIQGGGNYLSRFFGSKNVTIVGANQSVLRGVTITNGNPRGYGLWIESSHPQVSENTFTGSTQDGIAVTGTAAPTIDKNNVYGNGANGITISGNAKPQIRENTFQQTGFGINVAENAQPLIVGNSIENNRSGIIAQANSRPILRNNVIQGNKEDGLVAIYQAMPDLGNGTEPGGNEFANNGRYDINASAAKQIFSVHGNSLGRDRIAGQVDFSAPKVATTTKLPTPTRQLLPLPRKNRLISNNNSSNRFTRQLPPLPKKTRSLSNQTRTSQKVAVSNSGFPTPPNSVSVNSSNSRKLNYVRIDSKTIEFKAPKPPTPSVGGVTRQVRQQNLPVLDKTPANAAQLPVPGANIPGMGNDNIINQVPSSYTNTLTASNTENPQVGSRYRVMAQIQTQRDEEIVRFLAPDAFPMVWQGQAYMQVGVFNSPYNATNMQKTLNENGLKAVVQPVNY